MTKDQQSEIDSWVSSPSDIYGKSSTLISFENTSQF